MFTTVDYVAPAAVDAALWRRVERLVAGWDDPIVERHRREPLAALEDPGVAVGFPAARTRSMAFASGTRVVHHPDEQDAGVLRGSWFLQADTHERLVARGVDVLRAVGPLVTWGHMDPQWGRLRHLPSGPPLQQGVAAVGAAAWMDGWFLQPIAPPDGVRMEVLERGSVLLARLLDETDRDGFEARALPQDMALWFQAAPGYTTPPDPPGPGAPPQPPPVLGAGTFDPATGLVEYTADVGPDVRVTWWEVAELAAQVRQKWLADGREIRGVRVVFSRDDAALANMTPLLDAGVRLYAVDADGDEVEITCD